MSYSPITKSYVATPKTVSKKWYVIDATNLILGRLAAEVSKILRGKHKPYYTPFINCGDNVIIINAEKVVQTGKKLENEKHYWHTGYPGGIREITRGEILTGKFPQRLIKLAVKRMLPKESPLAREQLKGLYIYGGSEHPHTGQQPEEIVMVNKNKKNKYK